MKSITKILILCDAHDCLRHEGVNQLLLKQLYVTVFLLKKHFALNDFTLNVNNRGIISFESFWRHDHRLNRYLNGYILQKDWNDIDMLSYDLIITHPDYQTDLQQHFIQRYGFDNESGIYSFSELQYHCPMLYKSAASLFGKKGSLPFDQNVKNQGQLSEFKQEFDTSIHDVTIDEQEVKIPHLDRLMKKINGRFQLQKTKKVLILDDYKRPFFIGDSVYWLAKIKKLTTILPEESQYCLNINNSFVFESVYDIFQKSLPKQIRITNENWNNLSFNEYDLVLCNNDILLKFYYFINSHDKHLLKKLVFYSFSVMDERPISKTATVDFYTNCLCHIVYSDQVTTKINANISNELSLLQEEHVWANNWLKNKGIKESEHLIVLLHGASNTDKVIYDLTLCTLIKNLSRLGENIKILLVTEKKISTYFWLNEIISKMECADVMDADGLSLREVMCLFTNQSVGAIIGPCTGLMHLADGVYSYLLNHQFISNPPLLLTYAGKQAPERKYHPNNWWIDSNHVSCAVHMYQDRVSNKRQLLLLEDCPLDFEEFNRESISAQEIEGELLFKFIADNFPKFIHKYRGSNKDNFKSVAGDLVSDKKKIPTFIISLKHRTDRRKHILKQFEGRQAFDCTLVDAIETENGRLGLWLTIKKIVSESDNLDHEYILLCEDDHQFTSHYSEPNLFACIENARILNADILLGGISFCDHNIKKLHNNLIAVHNFAGTQFVILFRSFFNRILTAEFLEHDCADLKMVALSDKKLVVYPFISIQKDFGYSDVSDGYYENKMATYYEETSRLISETIKH